MWDIVSISQTVDISTICIKTSRYRRLDISQNARHNIHKLGRWNGLSSGLEKCQYVGTGLKFNGEVYELYGQCKVTSNFQLQTVGGRVYMPPRRHRCAVSAMALRVGRKVSTKAAIFDEDGDDR